MATDLNIIQDFDTYYNEAYYAWSPYFPEAETDLRYFLGDQWDEREKRQLFQEGRSTLVFNLTRRNVNMVTGYQIKNQNSSVVIPVEDGDQKTADQLSKVLLYVLQQGQGYQTFQHCFGGGVKTGWNLGTIWVDYREDPVNGDIRFGREPYNGFICDPYFTQLDFSDCGYVLRRKYLNVDHVASLLPGQEKEVYALYHQGWERDDKFTWLPYQRQPNGQQLMAYSEMFLQKWRNVPMLVDTETGEFTEWDGDRERLGVFKDLYPNIQVVERPKRYIELQVIVNDHVMYGEMDPFGLDEYPFAPCVALFEPESDQWGLKVQSLIRCMRDPQKELNRRRSQMIDIQDSQINSGWIADENCVVNPRSLFQTSQGKVIWRRQDAREGALEKIPPAQIPPSMFQLQELFDRDIVEIPGINDAAFGITENAQESGVMMMLQQGAATISLQDVINNFRIFQKAMSKKALKIIQTWTPEKIKRILNEEPTPQIYNKDLTKYDIAVQEGILSDTQKQMYFRQLVDLKQLGVPVSGKMLAQAAPIQGKSDFIEQLEQEEKAQAEAAQRQQQAENQLLQSQGQLAQAKAISDLALSKERFTRAVANLGLEDERASKAVEDRSTTALNKIKAIKELQTIDDDRLVKYIQMIQMLEEIARGNEEEIKEQDVEISAASDQLSQISPQTSFSPGNLFNQQAEVANA